MSPPIISIIIVTWNTALITKKCISSIFKYIPKKVFEIILVDNGSTDSTQLEFFQKKDIIYIRNKENLGFSKANNIGAKIAHGKYLLFLNSDMLLTDSSLLSMFEYYQNNIDIGTIGPKYLNYDLTPQASVFPPQTIINAYKEYWLKQKNCFSKYIPKQNNPTSVWSISGGALLIKKELFFGIGGWDEKYFFYFEDLDLCRTIRLKKLKIVYYPQCKIIHYHGLSGSKLIDSSNQWRRLIPSSIIYHGRIKHYILTCILWLGQKIFST